jgi:acid phosphatase (class A)
MRALLTAAVLAVAGCAHAQTPQAAPPRTATFVAPEALDLAHTLPRWPADDTLAGQTDLETVRDLALFRTPELAAEADADAPLGPVAWTARIAGVGFGAETHPRTAALLVAVHDDMRAVNRAANAVHGWRERPSVRDPSITPSLSLGGQPTPAYPSARTAGSRVWAGVLCDLSPAHCPAFEAAAARTAWLRVLGGVHYPSDVTGGRIVGDAFLVRLRAVPGYQTALDAARSEWAGASMPQRSIAP